MVVAGPHVSSDDRVETIEDSEIGMLALVPSVNLEIVKSSWS